MADLHWVLVQADLHWEDRDANLHMFDRILEKTRPGQVVLLPEMFTTGFSMRPSELAETMESVTLKWMRDAARTRKIVLGGSLMIAEQESFRNRFVWMLPNGEYSFYDKRHLFAYANEQEHYTPGDNRVIVSVNGWKIHLQVCYDLRFPAWARQQIRDGNAEYDVLVYVANWPERRVHAWKSLLVARAIENQCYVVGVNRVGTDGNGIAYNGQSMIVDPLGEIVAQAGDQPGVVEFMMKKDQLDGIRQKFPFLRDADEIQILT